jgi:hypothetical protein
MEDKGISSQPSHDAPTTESQLSCNNTSSVIDNNIAVQTTMDKPCSCGKQGCSCGSEADKILPVSYVYAIGRVTHRFPNKSIESELAQATGRRSEGDKGSHT